MPLPPSAGSTYERHPGAACAPLPQGYRRREPEKTVLYGLVQEHLSTMLAEARARSEHGFGLPRFVEKEFERYLACGLLCHGFARVRCEDCGDDQLVAFSCKGRGVCPSCTTRRMHDTAARLVDHVLPAAPYRQWVLSFPRQVRFFLARDPRRVTAALGIFLRVIFVWQRRAARRHGIRAQPGAVSWVQRFGGLINLNVHFHSILPDGVFERTEDGSVRFHRLPPPRDDEMAILAHRIAARVSKLVGRTSDGHEEDLDALSDAQAAAVQLPLALASSPEPAAPQAGRRCAFVEGYSLHADVEVPAHDRAALERLCRYAARPPLSLSRLAMTDGGKVAWRLRRPAADDSRLLVFEPVEFLRRLATLVPPPRAHLTRYHGIFAPRSADRAQVVPRAPREEGAKPRGCCASPASSAPPGISAPPRAPAPPAPPAAPARAPATVIGRWLDWAALLQRVFAIDVLRCARCDGRRRVIAFLTDPVVVHKVLSHLRLPVRPPSVASARDPPQHEAFDGWSDPESADVGADPVEWTD